MNQVNKNLCAWVLYDPYGFIVSGSLIKRPRRIGKPKSSGNWRQIPISVCCTPGSFILFRNTTASANITAISTATEDISWTGTLANGQYLIFSIPNGYNETFNITVDTPAGRTLTSSVIQQDVEGTATIGAIGAITLATNSTATNVSPGAQFMVILS